tara:strand:+ start:18536 stop:18733 length:198 start_codon:yes stop_codon:yes gene_type:complete
MDSIRRIRPESKRKAVRAAFFCDSYQTQIIDALDRGDVAEAEWASVKYRYWLDLLAKRTAVRARL